MSKHLGFKQRKLETSSAFSDYTKTLNPDDFENMMQNEVLKFCAKSGDTSLSLPLLIQAMS